MRRHAFLLGSSVLVAIGFAVACSKDFAEDQVAGNGGLPDDDASLTYPPVVDSGPPQPEAPAGTGLSTGLPCDVQAVLEDRCIACHSNASPPPLLTYTDLIAPSLTDPKKTRAILSLERMKSKSSPMPPPPAAPPDEEEIKVFEEWVQAGTPRNPTACTDPPPDGGVMIPDGGGDGGLVCTSGKYWVLGNQGSAVMHPGMACNACHQVMGGPALRIGGTVYPTLHEPDDCQGSAPPPQLNVVITDSRNKVFTLPVNGAGNFEARQMIKAPYRVKVVDANNPAKVRSMISNATSGDCNSCHTVQGKNNAPGRILAP